MSEPTKNTDWGYPHHNSTRDNAEENAIVEMVAVVSKSEHCFQDVVNRRAGKSLMGQVRTNPTDMIILCRAGSCLSWHLRNFNLEHKATAH